MINQSSQIKTAGEYLLTISLFVTNNFGNQNITVNANSTLISIFFIEERNESYISNLSVRLSNYSSGKT